MKIRFLFHIFLYTAIFFLLTGHHNPVSGGSEAGLARPAGDIRQPAVAGSFYPASAKQLRRMVTALLDSVPEIEAEGSIISALAPHAGYIYSGSVAAHTFKLLSRVEFDTLVIIGHDSYRKGVAFTCPADYFQTPLGKVPLDREMMERMHDFNSGIKPDRLIHGRDHTIEVQLPFLQAIGKRCRIVPVLFGNPTPKNCRILTDAILAASGDKKVLVLASTDMSHYPTGEAARTIDNSTLDELKTLDIDRLFKHLRDQRINRSIPGLQTAMCAKGGVGTAMLFAMARGADHIQVLRYANSGDVQGGDRGRVVGYSSVLISRKGHRP